MWDTQSWGNTLFTRGVANICCTRNSYCACHIEKKGKGKYGVRQRRELTFEEACFKKRLKKKHEEEKPDLAARTGQGANHMLKIRTASMVHSKRWQSVTFMTGIGLQASMAERNY